MRKGFWVGILTVSCCAYLPLAHADYLSESEFNQNGMMASTLEKAIDTFLMPIEVQLIGNAVYNDPISLGSNLPSITPSSSPQMDFVTQHSGTYCSPKVPTEATAFQCQGQTGNLNNDSATAQMLEMGDVRPSVLLEPVMYNQALTYAAVNLVRNLTLPFPSLTFKNFVTNASTFSGNASQKRAYANYMANQGYLSVARYALDEMFGMRVAGSYLSLPNNSNPDPKNQSIMQIMENEATRRFGDPNYAGNSNAFLNASTTQQIDIMRDMAAMQAFQLWMDYHAYRQNERIAALLAALLSNNVSGAIQGAVSAINAGAPAQ